jgi:hypothetical protein
LAPVTHAGLHDQAAAALQCHLADGDQVASACISRSVAND